MQKKILTLLALLMTAVTGAWAQEQSETIATTAKIVEGTHFTISNNNDNVDRDGMVATKGITVTAKNGETITKVVITSTYNNAMDSNTSVSSGTKEITNSGGTVTVTGVNASTFTFTCSNGGAQFSPFVVYYTEAPAPTTVNLTRGTGDKANEWTMDGGMPAGNVRVNVEYYDYAELTAADAIAANNAARAQTDDLLATVAENPATGGTLMYYLTTDATFTQAQALALAETDWSSTVPTAEDIDGAGATVYLWYYIKGDDEHSDTDPVQLTVNVQPEPTYNVTFAEGVNPEAPADPVWTATPSTGVKKDETVTVTYTGERKVIGVRAEKKAEPTK